MIELITSQMSIFELLMLACFGAAWPFSIYKGIKSKSVAGKSVLFIYVVLFGYMFGFIHKVLYYFDFISYLYLLNGTMVLIDLMVYYRNIYLLKPPKLNLEQKFVAIRTKIEHPKKTVL